MDFLECELKTVSKRKINVKITVFWGVMAYICVHIYQTIWTVSHKIIILVQNALSTSNTITELLVQ